MSELLRITHLLAERPVFGNPDPERLLLLLRRLRRVAVVGISRDPLKAARRVPSYLATKGVDIEPVNPHAGWILGRPVVPALDDVLGALDLVLIFRPSEAVAPIMEQTCRRTPIPAIWLQEGIRNDEAAERARDLGAVVVQDLCLFKAHRVLDSNQPRLTPLLRR
jgi:predicted CoA-binding protein